jgi:type I restriction enzyme R subunit
MTNVGQPERVTQNFVIALFRDELQYRPLWTDRAGNNNIEADLRAAGNLVLLTHPTLRSTIIA